MQVYAAGFTSKEAYQMGIPAIGIVAVLVANVTFVAWVTPPRSACLAVTALGQLI